MRFAFTDEQLLFRRSVRDQLRAACPPASVRDAWGGDEDGHNERSRMRWEKLAALGVLGLVVPVPYGGLGLDEVDLVLALEECGRVALPEPIVETAAVAAPLLAEVGDARLRDEWLAPIASGERIVTVGLAKSPLVVDADLADLLILERGAELHAVPRADVRAYPRPSVDGARRLFAVEWEPSDRTHIASGEVARAAASAAFDRGALAVSAQLLGLGRHMLDVTVEYAKVRHQFGKPIGSFQAIKHHLADALVKLELAAPVVYRAAYSVAKGDGERATHVSIAKALASEAALFAARTALQCHGAIGYSYEYDLHLWMKRSWALAASWGDAAWHRARVADRVLT